MIISSRTPDGEPNHCPVCGHDVRIAPSLFFGDAPCPYCGALLWFLKLPGERRIFDQKASQSVRERVLQIIARQLGVPPEQITADTPFVNDLGADSLDTVELVMELEEEFDLS